MIFHSWNTKAHLTKAAFAALIYTISPYKFHILLWVQQGFCISTHACHPARVPFVLICHICSNLAGDEMLACHILLLCYKVQWNKTLNLNNGAASENMNKMSFSAIHKWEANLHYCHAISDPCKIKRCLLMPHFCWVKGTPSKDMGLFTCFEKKKLKKMTWKAFDLLLLVPWISKHCAKKCSYHIACRFCNLFFFEFWTTTN